MLIALRRAAASCADRMPPAQPAARFHTRVGTATKLRWGLTADEAEQKALLERADRQVLSVTSG